MTEHPHPVHEPDASSTAKRRNHAAPVLERAGGMIARWWRANVQARGLPARVRTMVRRRESWLVLLAVIVGGLAGLMVLVLRELAYGLQQMLYQLEPNQRLSALGQLPFDAAFIPAAGGVVLGAMILLLRRYAEELEKARADLTR